MLVNAGKVWGAGPLEVTVNTPLVTFGTPQGRFQPFKSKIIRFAIITAMFSGTEHLARCQELKNSARRPLLAARTEYYSANHYTTHNINITTEVTHCLTTESKLTEYLLIAVGYYVLL